MSIFQGGEELNKFFMPGFQLNFIRNKYRFDMHFTDDGDNGLVPIIKKRTFIDNWNYYKDISVYLDVNGSPKMENFLPFLRLCIGLWL